MGLHGRKYELEMSETEHALVSGVKEVISFSACNGDVETWKKEELVH